VTPTVDRLDEWAVSPVANDAKFVLDLKRTQHLGDCRLYRLRRLRFRAGGATRGYGTGQQRPPTAPYTTPMHGELAGTRRTRQDTRAGFVL